MSGPSVGTKKNIGNFNYVIKIFSFKLFNANLNIFLKNLPVQDRDEQASAQLLFSCQGLSQAFSPAGQ